MTRCFPLMLTLTLTLAALSTGLTQPAARATEPVEQQVQPGERPAAQRPRIEVCFVLDTTGSMGGLIAGAKQKIWSMVNQMAAARPTPDIRIALLAFRDRGDEYVTRLHDLTDDLDVMFGHLQAMVATGGGDEPESVNQALHEAVTRVSWSGDPDVLKIIFLVGDAPPHMNYPDDVKYHVSCELAVRNDIIINTIQCGNNGRTTPFWTEIARLGEGAYAQIGQTGDMAAVTTPMDAELSRLRGELSGTVVAYGDAGRQRQTADKLEAAAHAAPEAAAERMSYMRLADAADTDASGGPAGSAGTAITGRGDLVRDALDGTVVLDELAEAELPDALRAMTPEQRREHVQQQAQQRGRIQGQIDQLLEQRQQWLIEQARQGEGDRQRDAFDTQVSRMIREQAARKQIEYPDGNGQD